MRGVCGGLVIVASAGVMSVAGCGEDDVPGPRDTYDALAARTEIECGFYTHDTPPDEPMYLCGDKPDVSCINAAIAGTKIAHLEYGYTEPGTFRYRAHNYFAGDGSLVWIGFFEGTQHPAWYHSTCRELVVTPLDVDGASCWKIAAVDCVRISSPDRSKQ